MPGHTPKHVIYCKGRDKKGKKVLTEGVPAEIVAHVFVNADGIFIRSYVYECPNKIEGNSLCNADQSNKGSCPFWLDPSFPIT